ncbi:MAG TPA: hypothetical protein VK074_11400 [Fodinibius sp.]|nr:hypothetical protein [Fodinibius sp.]
MNIGIVGPADRAVAWEKHLRDHQLIKEVTITRDLKNISSADACLLIDDSEERFFRLLEAVKSGLHTFLIAPLPRASDAALVEQTYHASQEANVRLQFSHWPTLAPSSKWLSTKIIKPSFIHISRSITHAQRMDADFEFDYLWINELAFCLRWISGSVHHIDLNTASLKSGKPYALHLLLRFDSGATTNIYINTTAAENSHQRVVADQNYLANYDVLSQTIGIGEESKSKHLFFDRQSFDASRSAELAVMEFIKSIRMKRPAIYNGYHLMKLTKTLKRIDKRLNRT